MKEFEQRAQAWLDGDFDQETKIKIQQLRSSDPAGFEDAFYKNLEFGTGGLRGIMGVGTNRMNRYTVGMATQGLANYILSHCDDDDPKVVISYDSRNNSKEFARITADVLSANGIHVYIFDNIRPTPEMSYAVRLKGAVAGVMITASHNPSKYNGYKVYGPDGCQITTEAAAATWCSRRRSTSTHCCRSTTTPSASRRTVRPGRGRRCSASAAQTSWSLCRRAPRSTTPTRGFSSPT